jgi:hypothetical protein
MGGVCSSGRKHQICLSPLIQHSCLLTLTDWATITYTIYLYVIKLVTVFSHLSDNIDYSPCILLMFIDGKFNTAVVDFCVVLYTFVQLM